MHHHHPHHCSPPLCEPLCQLPCHPHSRGTGRGLLQSRQRAQGEIEVLCQNHKNPAADTTSFTNVDEFVESVLAVLYAPDPEGEEHNSSLHTIHKLDQLCANTDVGEGIVVEFLNRRNSCLRATSKLDSKFPNLHPICSQLVALIVKSCLSIRECNRPPFSVIEKLLYSCASIVFSPTVSAPTTTDDEIALAFNKCLSSLAFSFSHSHHH